MRHELDYVFYNVFLWCDSNVYLDLYRLRNKTKEYGETFQIIVNKGTNEKVQILEID